MEKRDTGPEISDWIEAIGVCFGHHVLVHSAFKKIRNSFPRVTVEGFITALQQTVGPRGSIIMPAFTYCLKNKRGAQNVFSAKSSPSLTGAVTEVFRTMPGVARTASPTHSFAFWGAIRDDIPPANSPSSPLGKGSVMEWMCRHGNTHILMAGADFTSFTFGHYLEILSQVPYTKFFPFRTLEKLSVGISENGEQRLTQVPGCSRGFTSFKKECTEHCLVKDSDSPLASAYYFSVKDILDIGVKYFKENYANLMCAHGACPVCDYRRQIIHNPRG